MSYDIYMEIDTGSEYLACVSESHNYTYNVSSMYQLAFGKEGKDSRYGINKLHGMLGKDAAPLINAAMIYMQENKDEMQKLNPENGWGNFDGALNFLGKILEEAMENPKAMVGIH